VEFFFDKKEIKLDLKVFLLDLNTLMVGTITLLWYLPHATYGTYHISLMVGTIM